MVTNKEQTLKFGLKSQPESDKSPNLKVPSEDDFSRENSFRDDFISAVINKAGLDAFFRNISMQGLRLSKTDKKKLWKSYNAVIESNFLNLTTLSEELGTINLVSAANTYLHREEPNNQEVNTK